MSMPMCILGLYEMDQQDLIILYICYERLKAFHVSFAVIVAEHLLMPAGWTSNLCYKHTHFLDYAMEVINMGGTIKIEHSFAVESLFFGISTIIRLRLFGKI
ncbi:unnamed protein product [Ilex paraguariensis]|uniref:Uncharacterized protein n=1 Tax=Ilex paraguariensis TaxID=185542 RepID=A0ABC8QYJ6_9AQUA